MTRRAGEKSHAVLKLSRHWRRQIDAAVEPLQKPYELKMLQRPDGGGVTNDDWHRSGPRGLQGWKGFELFQDIVGIVAVDGQPAVVQLVLEFGSRQAGQTNCLAKGEPSLFVKMTREFDQDRSLVQFARGEDVFGDRQMSYP